MKAWPTKRPRAAGLAAVMIVFVWATEAAGQYFQLGQWGGQFETVVEYRSQNTKSGASSTSRLQDVLSEERFSLRNDGAYIYDPDLIRFSVGGTFGLSQKQLKFSEGSESRYGTILGYNLFAGILSGRPLSLNLFASRDQSSFAGGLAGQNDVVRDLRGGTLFATRLYIPSTLTFRQELSSEESRVSGTSARRKDQRNVLTYIGQRGWTDSEMNLSYELVDLTDDVFPNLSYQSHEGKLYYGLDFGPELNRHWDARFRFFTRTGVARLTSYNADQLFRFDHSERLQTDYRYSLNLSETSGGKTMTHSAGIHLGHRLYESLRTDLNLDATFQSIPGGQQNMYRGRADFTYTKRIPWDGKLQAGLGGGMQYNSNRFQGTEGFVLQENHTAGSPLATPLNLVNPFVVSGSVVVTKISAGPLPAGCFLPPGPPTPLVLGRDYTLQTFGDITQIVPIPCSGTIAGINPGDTIAVDYRFSVSPSLSFTTFSWHFNLSLDYKWLRPYFIHEQIQQTLTSGRDGRFLDDQTSDILGTELRYEGRRFRTSSLIEARHFSSGRNPFNAVRSSQYVGYTILRDLDLTFSTEQAMFFYSKPQRKTRMIGGRLTLSYTFGGNLFAEAYAGIRALRQSFVPAERIMDSGIRVRWFYRNIELLPSLEFSDRKRGSTVTREFRAALRLIRRF